MDKVEMKHAGKFDCLDNEGYMEIKESAQVNVIGMSHAYAMLLNHNIFQQLVIIMKNNHHKTTLIMSLYQFSDKLKSNNIIFVREFTIVKFLKNKVSI